MIKHQVNEHAGDGNVKPDRHRPFGDPAVLVPAALKDRNQGENDERQGGEGEQNVGRQHWKINCCQPTAKTRRFFSDVDVISDIANEKKGGGNDRRDHANDVALPKIPPDKIPAGRNENSTDKIERGIDCR